MACRIVDKVGKAVIEVKVNCGNKPVGRENMLVGLPRKMLDAMVVRQVLASQILAFGNCSKMQHTFVECRQFGKV